MFAYIRPCILVVPSLCFGFQVGGLDQQCGRFHNGYEPTELVSYLREQVNVKSDSACIVCALRNLKTDRAALLAAAPLLTEYLDYKRPLNPAEKSGAFRRPPTISELYPASSALFSIGKDALPLLTNAIGNAASSETTRENAVYTLMNIFRDDETAGIRFLRQEAAKTKGRAKRLTDAARQSLRWCASDRRSGCEAALND